MIYMETKPNNQFITTLVTRMILQIAPREMQLFQGEKEEYLRNPQQIINNRGFTSQTKGPEKIVFLAPIIHNILSDVVSMLEPAEKTLDEHSFLQMSAEKAKKIYAFAHEKAQQCQLTPSQAHLVADAVLRNLTASKTTS